MGMSTHIVGFRPADAKWEKMRAAYEACEAAGVSPPDEVTEFFCDEPLGDRPGMEVDIEDSDAIREWSSDSMCGYDIDVKKIPRDVTSDNTTPMFPKDSDHQ